jgi:hypothetical protein
MKKKSKKVHPELKIQSEPNMFNSYAINVINSIQTNKKITYDEELIARFANPEKAIINLLRSFKDEKKTVHV